MAPKIRFIGCLNVLYYKCGCELIGQMQFLVLLFSFLCQGISPESLHCAKFIEDVFVKFTSFFMSVGYWALNFSFTPWFELNWFQISNLWLSITGLVNYE